MGVLGVAATARYEATDVQSDVCGESLRSADFFAATGARIEGARSALRCPEEQPAPLLLTSRKGIRRWMYVSDD